MTASLETLVVAAYVFADSLRIPRPGPAGHVCDQEIIALAVAQAITGRCSDRQFLGTIGRLLPGFFPALPDQAGYNRRLRRLIPWITTVQLMLAELIAEGQVRLADGTLIACANYPGCQSKSDFAGHAAYGYCPAKSQFIWGMRLVLLADRRASPSAMTSSAPRPAKNATPSLTSPPPTPAAPCSPTGASGAASTSPRCTSSTSSWSPRPSTRSPSGPRSRSPRPASGS